MPLAQYVEAECGRNKLRAAPTITLLTEPACMIKTRPSPATLATLGPSYPYRAFHANYHYDHEQQQFRISDRNAFAYEDHISPRLHPAATQVEISDQSPASRLTNDE